MAALPPTHQGEIIYIIGRCHGNKAPISIGAVSVGGGYRGVSGTCFQRRNTRTHAVREAGTNRQSAVGGVRGVYGGGTNQRNAPYTLILHFI